MSDGRNQNILTIMDHKNEQNNDSLIEPFIKNKTQPSSRFVYRVSVVSIYWSYVGEVFFAWYTRKFIAIALTDIIKANFGNVIPDLPEQYGANLSCATPLVEVTANVISALDFLQNIRAIDAKGDASVISKNLPNGFFAGLKNHLSEMNNKRFSVGVPTILFFIHAIAATWADLEPIKDSVDSWLGDHVIFPWNKILSGTNSFLFEYGGIFYFCCLSFADVQKSMDWMLNREEERLDVPQASLCQQLWKNKEIATPLQVFIETYFQHISRGFTFGFLLKRFCEQQISVSPISSIFGLALGGCSGLVISLLTRHRRGFEKYYGTKQQRLDLIIPEQRAKSYAEIYSHLTWPQFLCKELIRVLSLLPIAEVCLPTYFVTTRVSLYSDEFSYLRWLPIFTGALTSVAVYWLLYRRANLNLELNHHALMQKSIQKDSLKDELQENDVTTVLVTREQENDSNEDDEEDQQNVKISCCGKMTASMLTFFSQTARLLTSTATMLKTLQGSFSQRDIVVSGASINIITGYNNYNYMQPKVESSLSRNSCFQDRKAHVESLLKNQDPILKAHDKSQKSILSINNNS